MSLIQRALSPLVEVRKEESVGMVLMFTYSFLAMTAYNVLKPVTRSKYISDLGADNLPYVLLVAGLLIGVLMTGYSWLIARLPRRGALAITQVGMAGLLIAFWFLFQTNARWTSAAFYLVGLILGILLISQFWTVANLVYDARQAKRLFGFIGGGAPLGGMAGSFILQTFTDDIGTTNMLLISSGMLVLCALLVWTILRRTQADPADVAAAAKEEKGVGFTEALGLLRDSKHLQIIALVISFAAVGAAIIEQQLNMAAEAAKGAGATDSITIFLAKVQLWTSTIGFIIQIWLTSKIHRYLGIGFALMVLPVSLGASAVVMLFNAALWAPGLARVLDQSLRYTVDKTTREILFLPLPGDLKVKAKSFVDVTVDRMAKAGGALLLLVLVQPWGLNLNWQQLSYASLSVMALWIFMSFRARRGYLAAFRQSIERRDLRPAELRLSGADLSTVETLVQELSHPQPARVVYAIDMLESLEKSSLVTPLLLFHEAPEVRERALRAIGEARSDIATQWVPQVRRALADPHPGVQAAALRALGAIAHEDAATLARPMLADQDPRIRATAAVALASSQNPGDVAAAEATLGEIVSGIADDTRTARREVAAALGHVKEPRFQRLLIPLMYDPSSEVADEAMESVGKTGTADYLFVPALVSLLRNRHLKGRARSVLVGYGQPVIDTLAHFMGDENEDVWIRRHIPSTVALIPAQKSVDALVSRLEDPDRFLRYKVMAALGRLRREVDGLKFPADKIEAALLREARQFFMYLSLGRNLATRADVDDTSLIATGLREKIGRGRDRIYQLLALIFPPSDIAAAQWTLAHGDARNRASASEYLDNLLTGAIRKMVMPILEDLPVGEQVRRGNVLIRTRPRDLEETLLQLINDDDQVISACAIELVRQRKVWALAGDIEHVLAHRDVRDWFVFEAASWALAEHRMPAERRRELWLEPLPAAVLASELRALPLFSSVSIDELFRIAGAARQIRHEAGTTLIAERSVPEMLHVLLDGQVTITGGNRPPETVSAPAALGFLEALQSKPMRRSARTAGVAVTLALTTEELRTQLAYNPELVRGLFATMADRARRSGRKEVFASGAATDLQQLAVEGLQPVEKVLAIQRVGVFRHFSAQEAQHLARITRTVDMKAGAQLFKATERPATWLIMSGEVELEANDARPAAVARGGDVIGSFVALAGPSVGQNARVTQSGVALQIDRDDLFEVLGDRPDMLWQLFAGLLETPGQALVSDTGMVSTDTQSALTI
ncbi:MAG: HEAT repeat domain-containing protein [Acidobacteria bacterium]|nr:HEAT repeat domain-containing protein [Acidobacteriota bacterium]